MNKVSTHIARFGHSISSTASGRLTEASMLKEAGQADLKGLKRYNALQDLYSETPSTPPPNATQP